ncbi:MULTISPECIES: hypothetical protein [unclassified Bradyrhizobium]
MDFWTPIGVAVAIGIVIYTVNDFRARLGRIEGTLNRILDRVYPEEAEGRRAEAWLAFEAKTIREGRWAWVWLILLVLAVGGWFLLRS